MNNGNFKLMIIINSRIDKGSGSNWRCVTLENSLLVWHTQQVRVFWRRFLLDEAYTLLPSPSVRQEQAAHSSFIASSILMQCLISIVVCHVDSNGVNE